MRTTLPIVLHNPHILLIGGGSVALQKAEVMSRNHIDFACVATAYIDGFTPYTMPKRHKNFEPSDLEGFDIIIDATGSTEVMEQLLALKQERGFLYNCVDVPEVCDFFFAALIQRGAVKVAVSSAGASPSLAQEVRDKIGRMIPKSLGTLAQELQTQRNQGIIDPKGAKARTRHHLGHVTLVGCGTGDVELLTLKAYRQIQEADVVFVDHLISDEIEAIIPESTLKIAVGKRKGFHSVSQERINAMLIEYAQKGLEVARLKAGDPYIFGRGAEEAQALLEAGVRVDVIPGISSAIAGPSSAGIAPTARGYATNLSIVSAHLAGNRMNTAWIDLLKMPSHTTIVLMGVSRAKEIVHAALRAEVDPTLPVAIVSNASRPEQKRITTTLDGLEAAAADAERPAIIIFGEVVHLHHILPQYDTQKEPHHVSIA